jgi:hypothetical protein
MRDATRRDRMAAEIEIKVSKLMSRQQAVPWLVYSYPVACAALPHHVIFL